MLHMQLQNYQEELLAPAPSHPRASLSNAYRSHLIPLHPSRGLQRGQFPIVAPTPIPSLKPMRRASLSMGGGLVSPLLGACNQSDLSPVLPGCSTNLTCRKRDMLVILECRSASPLFSVWSSTYHRLRLITQSELLPRSQRAALLAQPWLHCTALCCSLHPTSKRSRRFRALFATGK